MQTMLSLLSRRVCGDESGFRPRLPRAYRGQFGKNVKYLMDVVKDFWVPKVPTLSTDGPLDVTWVGTAGQPGPRAALVGFSGAQNAQRCRRMSFANR
jgi:hypothetical protein